MLSKFTTFTDVCMAGWQELSPSHTNVCNFDVFSNRNISFNFQHYPLIFAIFNKCASLFQFFVFSFAKLTIKFSIIYDNARSKTADINKDPPIRICHSQEI